MKATLVLRSEDGERLESEFYFRLDDVDAFYIGNDEDDTYLIVQIGNIENSLKFTEELYSQLLTQFGYD